MPEQTAPQQPEQPQREGFLATALRFALIYYAISYFTAPKQQPAQPPPAAPLSPAQRTASVSNDAESHASFDVFGAELNTKFNKSLHPRWPPGTRADLRVYLSQNARPSPATDDLIWTELNIAHGNASDVRQKEIDIVCAPAVQQNGTLYSHIFLTLAGQLPDTTLSQNDLDGTLYIRKELTRFMPKRKVKKTKKLVGSDNPSQKDNQEEQEVDEESQNENSQSSGISGLIGRKPPPIVSYWWPNVTINLVYTNELLQPNLPPPILKTIRIASTGAHYLPIFHVNDFWMLSSDLMPINETVKTLHLSLQFAPIEFWRHAVYIQYDDTMKNQAKMMGTDMEEFDMIKRMFLETNPILLGITIAVSILHSIFDFLAFKNDVQFWRNRKNNEGVSFRTIVLNVVFQIIIFLYLLDNDTSWLILLSNGAGLLIEMWKINKTVIVKRKSEFPYLEFVDRVKPTKLAAKTREYDEMAFKYLSYALYPLLFGYAIYSLVYDQHKSWYSYVVGTLVGFVYTFGFISMTPQLFINYKLKSVAHMPWKTFMYKALNTFIDDLFAFVIKMPWLHRLACLRDDVVFVVYLYQKWIYPEDKRRRNEFGQSGEPDVDDEDEDNEPDEKKPDLVETKLEDKSQEASDNLVRRGRRETSQVKEVRSDRSASRDKRSAKESPSQKTETNKEK